MNFEVPGVDQSRKSNIPVLFKKRNSHDWVYLVVLGLKRVKFKCTVAHNIVLKNGALWLVKTHRYAV